MVAVTASHFTSGNGKRWGPEDQCWGEECALTDLPQHASSLPAGENIMLRLEAQSSSDMDNTSCLVLWTSADMFDTVWSRIKSSFMAGRLGDAVAIAARKHKPDWYIQEAKRPFGQCRMIVYLPFINDSAKQTSAAASLAALLGDVNISHIFCVSHADVTQMQPQPSYPQAVRLTAPVYISPSHDLVYGMPDFGQMAAGTNRSSSSSSAANSTADLGMTQRSNRSTGSWRDSSSNSTADFGMTQQSNRSTGSWRGSSSSGTTVAGMTQQSNFANGSWQSSHGYNPQHNVHNSWNQGNWHARRRPSSAESDRW